MKRFLACCILAATVNTGYGQTIADSITEGDMAKMMDYLSSDRLKGRVNHSPEQLEVVKYLYTAFARLELEPYPGYATYIQPFHSGPHTPKTPEVFSWKDVAGGLDTMLTLTTAYLYNVVAVLPGKTRPGEAVIFSAHYDHICAGEQDEAGIFNGANDNASGTSAVLALAQYYSMRKDNERTIIFCLFAGEELGLLGSREFAEKVEADSIVAMVNIEMIGLTNAVGRNAFFLTGAEQSNLYDILKRNLKEVGAKMKVLSIGDPRNLFERSDNYPFVLKGVPAHSVMCSDDMEGCYHRPCDDYRYIRLENMTRVVQAIAAGCAPVISGRDTPRRIR